MPSVFAATMSGLPSPFTSPTATAQQPAPVAMSTFGGKLITPPSLMFCKMEIVPSPGLATIRSGLPSPSKSAAAILCNCEPVGKSNRGPNKFVVILPGVQLFLKT